jgi:hypothetical protein
MRQYESEITILNRLPHGCCGRHRTNREGSRSSTQQNWLWDVSLSRRLTNHVIMTNRFDRENFSEKVQPLVLLLMVLFGRISGASFIQQVRPSHVAALG